MLNRIGDKQLTSVLANYSIFILFVIVFLFMTILAPNFLSSHNMTTILKGTSLNAMVAIGFTVVLITGQLDLSISSNLSLGAMVVVGFQPQLGWGGSLITALIAGAIVGLINGILVAKAKIHSFMVTLGTMTIVQGAILTFSNGKAVNVDGFKMADFLDGSNFFLMPPRAWITIVCILAVEYFLVKTPYGKALFMIGANKETAWLAGLKTDRYMIGAFIFSGITAALGGALFGMSFSSAMPTIGSNSLITVLAATIIGGTSIVGGKGSVLKSFMAVMTLVVIFNGLNLMGADYASQIFANGFVLATVVLYEAFSLYRQERLKGQRMELMNELQIGSRK